MFKNKRRVSLWSIILTAILLCVGAIIGVEATISLCNSGEGGIKLFFGIVFLLLGAKKAYSVF